MASKIEEWIEASSKLKKFKDIELELRNEIIESVLRKILIETDSKPSSGKISAEVDGVDVKIDLKKTIKVSEDIQKLLDDEDVDVEIIECIRIKKTYELNLKEYKKLKEKCKDEDKYFLIDDYVTESPAQPTMEVL